MIDLNKLKYFQVTANTGTLIAASKILHVSTSAIYQAIKKLEVELNVHLFFRSGKKYILTQDGLVLLKIFQHFKLEFESFCHERSLADKDFKGEIRIGLPLNYSKCIFTDLIKKFSIDYPQMTFNLCIGETNHILKMVEQFQLDLAIVDESANRELKNKICKEMIYREELVMVSSANFNIVGAEEMQRYPHLAYSADQSLLKSWYQNQFQQKAHLKHTHIVDNVETVLALISADMGLGIVPKTLVEKAIAQKKLICHGDLEKKFYNNLYLIQNLDAIPNKVMKIFLQRFKNQ